jgi:hypothetical protein
MSMTDRTKLHMRTYEQFTERQLLSLMAFAEEVFLVEATEGDQLGRLQFLFVKQKTYF